MSRSCPWSDAKRWREATWTAIKTFMAAGSHEYFAAFLLQTRVVRKVPIRVLAAAVVEVDPMGVAKFVVPVPSALLAALRDGGEASVRAAGRETISPRFRGPRAARALEGKPLYMVAAGDADTIAAEYAAAWHDHGVLESERQELKERMRASMEHARLKLWGESESIWESQAFRSPVIGRGCMRTSGPPDRSSPCASSPL